MSTHALLSRHAILMRCLLRPSFPTQPRLLQPADLTQFSLPYPTEDGYSTIETKADPVISPRTSRLKRKMVTTENIEIREAKPAGPRQGKRKPLSKVSVPPHAKLLVGREEAAVRLSLSVRSVDYLLANKQLKFRRIGGRVLIPLPELERFARMDHPERIAS
jgi:excisionase family DNA binding protein